MKNIKFFSILFLTIAVISACGLINPKNKGKGFNLFPVQQDIDLGAQVAAEIDGNPTQYPLLDSNKYKEVYKYVYKVRDNILNSGKVDFKDDFKWRLRIIHDDSTLNAFCTPGGYIYIYTGILKFMDSEDQLAGVMGHEIGHADMRHSTRQMTAMFGLQLLEQAALGNNPNAITQITNALLNLKNSRSHETEADGRSVMYLCPTIYNAGGGAGFFQKLDAMGSGKRPPEFLSTHPNPEGRIDHFLNAKTTMGCAGDKTFKEEYKRMVSLLPK